MGRHARFVHASDLHLDAPFKGVDATDQRVVSRLVTSTYSALESIVDTCISREVDFLIVAGDLYNSRDKSLRAQLLFSDAAMRLAEAGISVYVVQGNHDPADGWSAKASLPESVHVFPTDRVEQVVVERNDEPLCTLYGRGFAKAAVTENLALGYRRDPSDVLAIGVLHANVGGQPGHEPYAPCDLDDLRAARMDYWALGHVHKPALLSQTPHVRYSGAPQGLNPREDGPHGCFVVDLAPDGTVTEEFVDTAAFVWARADIDVGELASIGELHAAVGAACDRLRASAAGRSVVARIDLVGRGAVHSELGRAGALADMLEDARSEQLGTDPWLWLDRLRDLTRPAIDIDRLRAGEDFTADLIAMADGLLADRAGASALVAEVVSPVEQRLRFELGLDPADVIERALDVCLDELLADEEAGQ